MDASQLTSATASNIKPSLVLAATSQASCPSIAASKSCRLFPPLSLSILKAEPVACARKRYAKRVSCTSVLEAASTEKQSLQKDASVQKKTKYHFVVANAKFMLDEEEHFQEQLKERLRLYGERNKQQDFWLVIEPRFLDKFPDMTKRLKRPAVALVSTDARWITFMKLRLDRVMREEYEASTLEEALQSSPIDAHFGKPEAWTAPYPKYETGWWTPFLFHGSQ